jgi:hypothetical protein
VAGPLGTVQGFQDAGAEPAVEFGVVQVRPLDPEGLVDVGIERRPEGGGLRASEPEGELVAGQVHIVAGTAPVAGILDADEPVSLEQGQTAPEGTTTAIGGRADANGAALGMLGKETPKELEGAAAESEELSWCEGNDHGRTGW